MKNLCLFLLLVGAALLGGCDKKTEANTEKIEALSQQIVQLQQNHARQLAELQSEMTSLAPMLDKMNSYYFTKTHDDAFFYHTNTLLLLLTVDRKIESQLQIADTEREAEDSLAYYFHTNQTDTMYYCTQQIEDAMAGQEKRIENAVNAQIRQVSAALGDQLVKEIKLSAPDKDESDRLMKMEADVAQLQHDMDLLKARFGITNPPPTPP
jgi:hypothetical protein